METREKASKFQGPYERCVSMAERGRDRRSRGSKPSLIYLLCTDHAREGFAYKEGGLPGCYLMARALPIRDPGRHQSSLMHVWHPLDIAASKIYIQRYICSLPMPLTKGRPFHTVPEAHANQTPTPLRTQWKRAAAHVQHSLRTYYYNTTRRVRNRRPLTGD